VRNTDTDVYRNSVAYTYKYVDLDCDTNIDSNSNADWFAKLYTDIYLYGKYRNHCSRNDRYRKSC